MAGALVCGPLGDFGLERQQGVINIPINDNVRFRAGIDQESRDGYLTNISGIGPRKFGNERYIAARASLVVDITKDIENYTIASFSQSDNYGTIEKLLDCVPSVQLLGSLACAQFARDAGRYTIENSISDPRSFAQQWQLINTTSWTASDNLTIKNIASYSQFHAENRASLFGFNYQVPSFLAPYGGQPWSIIQFLPYQGRTSDQQNFTEELKLTAMH